MSRPAVLFADFHNADSQGRVRLNAVGTISDLAQQQVHLQSGLVVQLYTDDADEQGRPQRLVVDGTVEYSTAEQCWVAVIDWEKIHAAVTPPALPLRLDPDFGVQPVLPSARPAP